MRVLMVVNSFASSVTARNTVVVHRELSQEHDVQIVETNRRGHATRFAQDAARRGVDLIVAYGGDGTLNEVATGIAGTSTALGVLPGGSTNVFARTLGLPNDPAAAAQELRCWLAAPDSSVRTIGLGKVNGRYFCFHTGVGYDAAVVRAVEKRANIKRWLGHPLFIYAAISTWARAYDRKTPHFELSFDDGTTIADGYFTVVLNTNPYTYLGNRPLDLSPSATLDNPLVAVTFKTMRLAPIAKAFMGAIRGGGMTSSEHVDVRENVRAVTMTHERPFPYQLDGDYLGETQRLAFTFEPDAVRVIAGTPSESAR